MTRKYTKRKTKEPRTPPLPGTEDPKTNRWDHVGFYLRARLVEKLLEAHDKDERAKAASAGEEYVDGPQTRLCWSDVMPALRAKFGSVPDKVQMLRIADAVRQASGLDLENDGYRAVSRVHTPAPAAPAPAPAPVPSPAIAIAPAPAIPAKLEALRVIVDDLLKQAAPVPPPPPATQPDLCSAAIIIEKLDRIAGQLAATTDMAKNTHAAVAGLNSRMEAVEAAKRKVPAMRHPNRSKETN